jgi:hypothetical protein
MQGWESRLSQSRHMPLHGTNSAVYQPFTALWTVSALSRSPVCYMQPRPAAQTVPVTQQSVAGPSKRQPIVIRAKGPRLVDMRHVLLLEQSSPVGHM